MVGFEPTQPEALVLQTSITLPRYRISIEAIVPFSWRSTNCWMQCPAIYIGAFSNITVRPDSYREKDCLRALTLPAAGRLSPPDVSGLRRHLFCLSLSFFTPLSCGHFPLIGEELNSPPFRRSARRARWFFSFILFGHKKSPALCRPGFSMPRLCTVLSSHILPDLICKRHILPTSKSL